MVIGFLVILVFFLLRAYSKSRAEIERLREDVERLDDRVARLFHIVRSAGPKEGTPSQAARASEAVQPRPPREEPSPTALPSAPLAPAGAAGRPFDRAAAWARERAKSLGWTTVVGVIVLFFGVAFLVKYAIDRDLLSVQIRLLAAAASGVLMLVFGYRTRVERSLFGLSLQGGGVGVLYLTVFAAFRLYGLVPAGAAFALLVGFVGLGSALALSQSSRVLMTLASTGGFLAPILTSTGGGHHVALFSYYLVLNLGILAVAWFRAWRSLNLVGFFFTFAVATFWGVLRYRPELFASTEPFLLAFFVLYVAVAVLFALRQEPVARRLVDGTIVFGVPLAVSVLQAALVRDFDKGLAWSAAAFGFFYVVLARALAMKGRASMTVLTESFLATGVVFLTLAVPFAFDELSTSALWALEGAAILWVGVRQGRPGSRYFGAALQLGAGLFFLSAPGSSAAVPVLNADFLGAVVIAVAGLVSAYLFGRLAETLDGTGLELAQASSLAMLAWGLSWWVVGSLQEIGRFAAEGDVLGWSLLLFAVTAAAAAAAGRELVWPDLERVALGLVPASAVVFLAANLTHSHPFEGLTGLGWLVAGASHALVLRLQRGKDRRWSHAGGLWLAALLLAWETSYRVGEWMTASDTWRFAAVGVVPAVFAWIVTRFVPSETYRTLGAVPLAVLSMGWLVVANLSSDGDPSPLPYVAMLNPLDVAAGLVLLTGTVVFARASVWLARFGLTPDTGRWLVAAGGFYWLHGVVARSAHHWAAVPFHADALFESTVVQTSVALLWAVTGLMAMVFGTRRGRRTVWAVGAGLMAGVVLKLFLVDLSHAETVARIVSFIAVGTLLLVVGYLSPVPPPEPEPEPSR